MSGYSGNGKIRKKRIAVAAILFLWTVFILSSPLANSPALAAPSSGETDEEQPEEQSGEEDETGFEDTNLARLSSVVSLNQYPLLNAVPDGENPDDYILLLKDTGSCYTVEKGDCLWGLAKNLFGHGLYWEALYKANLGTLGGSIVLQPGQRLLAPDKKYIRRQKDSLGGYVNVGAYSVDYPAVMYYGDPGYDVCLNVFFSKSVDAHIVWHVTEQRTDSDEISGNWPEARKKIEAAGKEICGGSLSNLSFENYTLGDGGGLYCYSFTCKDSDGLRDYMVCYRTGKRYTAEFIGYTLRNDSRSIWDTDVRIGELTRYVAASFRDMGGDSHSSHLKSKRYLGAESWPWESLHNPFAIAARKFEATPAPLDVDDYEITWAEPQIESFIRSLLVWYHDWNDEEYDAFMARKVKASELTWITELTFRESFLDERDEIAINEDTDRVAYQNSLKPLKDDALSDLKHFRNLKKISLAVGNVRDYSVLGELPKLEIIDIQAGRTIRDLSFLKNLPHLKELYLGKGSGQHLADMGFSMDTYQKFYSGEPGLGFNEVSDWSLLRSCPELACLSLRIDSLDSLDFLDALPNLYSFLLNTPDDAGMDATVGLTKEDKNTLLSENSYPQIKCLVLDGNWYRNEE